MVIKVGTKNCVVSFNRTNPCIIWCYHSNVGKANNSTPFPVFNMSITYDEDVPKRLISLIKRK